MGKSFLKKHFKYKSMFHYTLFNVPKLLTKKYIESVGGALEEITKIPQKGYVNIIVVSSKEIAALNETYRGKEGPTDILTFPYTDTVKKTTDIAGEIYLCLEKIQYYAEERWTNYAEQLKYIIIHWLVHMMGYDHETEEESQKMEKIEKRILALLKEEK